MSFRARAEAEGATLSAGFGFPSWQNQSAITQNFKLSTNWCSFTTTRELAPFLPDLVCASLTAERGRVWLDAVKVEQGPQATPFDPPWELTLPDLPLGMLLAPGQPLAAEILNRTPAAAEGQLRWRLFSPFGGEEARGEQPFACSPAARVALPLRFPAGLEGLFLLQHEFVVGGKTMARGRLRLAIGWPAPAGPNRPFFSSTPNYGSVLLDEPWRQQCRALSALGLGTLHLYLGLNRIRESATTDKLNRIVEGAQAAGLQWLFTPSDDNLFAGKSSWAPGPGNVGTEPIEAKPDGAKVTEAQLRAWQAELKDFIPRFRGKVKFWEICNEPNVLFTGDEYQRIAHVVAPLLRQLDPASHIAAGSVVNAHRSDLHRKTMELPPGTFDSFSYHPYRFGLRNPESEGMSFRRALLETKADLVAAGHAPKIWLTEEGQGPGLEETRCRGSYLSFDPLWTVEWGEGEIRQAQYLARMYLTALGEGCVGYSYHTLQNLVRDDAMTPSLALKAIHTMACVLATGEPKGPLALGDDFVGYQFTADRGTTVAALWMKDADYGSPVELPMTLPMAAQLSARNMLGGVVPVRSDGGKCSLRLDRQVIYLVFQNANPDAARQSLEAAFASFARCDAASSKPSTKMGQSTSWPARTAQERVVPDRQISAGWMHSGYPGWTLPTNLGATNRPKAVEPAVAQAKPPQKETKPAPKPRQPPAVVTATDAMVRDARLLRERFLADPYRPTYHFCVPEDMGRPGDPNGAFYHNGRYHLMYLYNRLESGFCWGHISSSDLVHWRHHPDAIGPGHGDEGCFSGGAFVDDDGAAYLSYWMLWDAKGIGLAKSSDAGFNVWTKLAANPVIKSTEWGVTETKDETGKTIFYGSADPSNIWKKDGRYYMLTGNLLLLNKLGRKPDAPLSEQGDRLYLFVSDNLKDWKYLHVFYERKPEWTDRSEDNMCPSFLPLPSSPDGGPASGKHLLLFISHNKGCQYYVGDYRNDRFFPNNHGRMSWVDNTHFAPEALMDGKGRQIMWAWLTDNPPGEKENGWSGVYGLPRSLWLGEDGTLRMQPVKELETLRSRETTWNNLALSDGETKPLEGVAGDSCELGMEIELGTAQRCGVKVRAAPGGEEETLLYYDADKKELVFDSTRSGKAGRKVVERAPFTLKTGEPLKLRVFVDKSVVELYANDRQAIGRRVYPTRPDSLGVSVFANGGPAKARQVKAWQIEPSNPY
ncbi:MAG: glycoside hydrolase family 32 protein [Planctomycetes bacterium]|nr:glycoside hydrolase family 32 protein [Planctomycetota bacterium]